RSVGVLGTDTRGVGPVRRMWSIVAAPGRRDNGSEARREARSVSEGRRGPSIAVPSLALRACNQHRADFRFAPSFPAFSIFAMYSAASGTLHDVSPMSTSTAPTAFAVAFAFLVSETTKAPTAIMKLFIVYRTRFGAV